MMIKLMLATTVAAALVGITTATTCDIYDAANTPCVAAHSLVRALFSKYSGPLYQVHRLSDNTTRDIGTMAMGGFADSAAQDAFCGSAQCSVLKIYDQSSKGNHIGTAPPGGAGRHPDQGVNAAREKLSVGGHPVYAAYFEGGMGYRNDTTTGIATGDEPESMYMVTNGKHYNQGCCFDYGNAEVRDKFSLLHLAAGLTLSIDLPWTV
jgi:non-reducing end alpha-L-arabinofuranosidase